MTELEYLTNQIKKGRISRREFMGRAAALGVTTALATTMLAQAGIVAEPKKGGSAKFGLAQGATTDTMDPGLTLTLKPFFYDNGSTFKNLTIDFSTSLFRERSDDTPPSVADERLITRLRVGDSRDAVRWALICTLERYDDRTAADLDAVTGAVGAEFGYHKETDRYTLSADLFGEIRIQGVHDPVRGRPVDTGTRIGAGTAVTFLFLPDYPTRCTARYEGIFMARESADDTYEHSFRFTFEQVMFRRAGLTGTLGLHGVLRDVSSPNPDLAYGERVFGIYMRLEF